MDVYVRTAEFSLHQEEVIDVCVYVHVYAQLAADSTKTYVVFT
jgi:hypothetical protein